MRLCSGLAIAEGRSRASRRFSGVFQFRLRGLFAVMTLAAVAASVFHGFDEQAKKEHLAAATLADAGGYILFDTDQHWSNKTPRPPPPRWAEKLLGPEQFRRVVTADLCCVDLTKER